MAPCDQQLLYWTAQPWTLALWYPGSKLHGPGALRPESRSPQFRGGTPFLASPGSGTYFPSTSPQSSGPQSYSHLQVPCFWMPRASQTNQSCAHSSLTLGTHSPREARGGQALDRHREAKLNTSWQARRSRTGKWS